MAEYATLDGEDPSDEDSTIPTKDLDPADLLLRIKAWFKEDEDHCREWHITAKEEDAFEAGDQWRQEDKDPKRPQLEFNRVGPVIDAVVGTEVTNRQEVRYIPRQAEDGPANEIFSEAARWFRDQCDAEHEESSAFRDTATTGMGWTDTILDYEDNPDGQPKIERVNKREMFWDTSNIKANLVGARRVYRVRQDVPIEECKARWPKRADGRDVGDDADYNATWANGEEVEPHDMTRPVSARSNDPEPGHHPRTATLVQVQWWERETYYRSMTVDPMTGAPQMMEMSEDEHQKAQARAAMLNIPYRGVQQIRKCFYNAFVGSEVLEVRKMVAPSGKPATGFSLNCITGKLDQSTGHFYGLVRGMRGPQEYANKWMSTIVEIMARGAKGGLLLEEGSVTDPEEFEKKWAQPGSNSYFKPGKLTAGAVQPKPSTQYPSDFMQMTTFAISSIRDVTGVNAEILGMAQQEQAASLEYQRRQSAVVILSPLFDSMKRYRRVQGRYLLYLITEYLSDARLIRITGPFGQKYVPLIRQPGVIEYDVIVDDAPSSPSQKEMVWTQLVQVAPLLSKLQIPPQAYVALMDYSPFPSSVVEKVKAAVAQQQAQPPPPTPADMKMQELNAGIEADKRKSDNELAAKAQMHQLDYAQSVRMAELDYAAKQQEINARAQEADQRRKDKELDHQIKLAQRQQEFELRSAMGGKSNGMSAIIVAEPQEAN